MKRNSALLVFILLSIQQLVCYGQNLPDSAKVYRIETVDGNIYSGKIISEDLSVLVLKTTNLGELRIQQSDIRSRTVLKDIKEVGGKIWLPNPQSSRYFWAPNGYGLEKGSSYYQNIWILYNQFSTGLTDNFSVGAGVLPLFLFNGAATPFWIVPKFSIPVVKDKVNLGAGAFVGTVLGTNSGAFGLLYETTTFGPRDKNLSLGLAWGFSQDGWMKAPIVNMSAMIRTGPKGYFITENYAITTNGTTMVLVSLGGRTIFGSVGLDYSLWMPFSENINSFVAIPFLGVTIPIVKKANLK